MSVDPHASLYILLREAYRIIADGPDGGIAAERWLAAFETLPGAELTDKQMAILGDNAHRDRRKPAEIDPLIETGYLKRVRHVGRHNIFAAVRITTKGKIALQLRGDANKGLEES